MPVDTRAMSYASTQAQLRDDRHDNRAASIANLRAAETNQDNSAFGLVYDAVTLKCLLLAHTDVNGNIAASDKSQVRQLFRDRQAWKLGTVFRLTWCNIRMLRVNLMVQRGWTIAQVEGHNNNLYVPDGSSCFCIFSLLFQGSPDPPVGQQSLRALAEMEWRDDISYKLWKLRKHPTFQANSATLTAERQVEYGLIPKHLSHSVELVKSVRDAISICASMRVFRDNVTPGAAFAAVVNSGGLRAEFFGGILPVL